MDTIKVVMPAHKIPVGSTVTKRTGQALYQLKDVITVYDANGNKREIKPLDGSRFIVNDRLDINSVGADTELMWHVDPERLYQYLEEYLEGPPQ